MNAFHVIGSLTAIWAVLVAFLGITREGFPGSSRGEWIVSGISILLVSASIGSGIITAANEDEEHEGEHKGTEASGLVLSKWHG